MTQVKTAVTAVPIHEIIASRYSARAFDAERAVDCESVTALLEAARWAPSCYNQQPWRFIIGNRFEQPESFERILNCLASGNQRWAKRAAVLIVVLSDRDTGFDNGDPNTWADYDSGAAGQNICLQATAMGLLSHQMGGFDAARLVEALKIPDGIVPIAVNAIGYPGQVTQLEGWQYDQELAERSRLPLAKLAFAGAWGQSFAGAHNKPECPME